MANFAWLNLLRDLEAGTFGSDPAFNAQLFGRIQQEAGMENWAAAIQAGYITPDGRLTAKAPVLGAGQADPGKGNAYVPVNSNLAVDPYTMKPAGPKGDAPVINDPTFGQIQAQQTKADPDWMDKWGPILASVGLWGPGLISAVGGLGAGGAAAGEGALSASDAYAALAGGEAATPFVPITGGGLSAADAYSALAGGEAPTTFTPTPGAATIGDIVGNPSDAYAAASGGEASTPFNPITGGVGTSAPTTITPPGGSGGLFGGGGIGGTGLTLGDLIRGGIGAAGTLYAIRQSNNAANQYQQGINNATNAATGVLGGGGAPGGTGAPGPGGSGGGNAGGNLPGGSGNPYGGNTLGPNGYQGGTLGMWDPYVQAGYDAINRIGSRPESDLYAQFGAPVKASGGNLFDKFGAPVVAKPGAVTLGMLARPKFAGR